MSKIPMYIILESIINFEIEQLVKINPDNPILSDKQGYNRVENANRRGKIVRIGEEFYSDYEGEEKLRRNGKIYVLWEKDKREKVINYKNLIIV